MQKTIMDIVEDVKQQELEYGINEYSVYNNDKNYYQRVIKYFRDHGTENYCQELLLQYLDEASSRHDRHEISGHLYASVRRSVKRIRSCATTGRVDFSKSHPKVYQPSPDGINLYNAIVEYNRCSHTISTNNQAILRNFICYLEKNSIGECSISDDVILNFITAAKTSYEQSNGYIRQSMALVAAYLKSKGVVLKINYGELQMKGKRKRVIEPYSADEISRIISSIDLDSGTGYRDKAIILLAYSTGLRAVDITSLNLTDINYKERSVSVIQNKTGKHVFLPVNVSALNAVADYIMLERPKSKETHIFLASKAPFNPLRGSRSLGNISRKYCRKAAIEKKPGRDFHSFRRSFASGLSYAGVPLTTISQMLGHSGINSDRPYLSYNEGQILRCALDFTDIPLTKGIYAEGIGGDGR